MEAARPDDGFAIGASAGPEADLVGIARDALLLTDEAGKIRFANPAAASLLNAAPEHLAKRQLVSLIEPAHRRALRGYVGRAAAGEAVAFSSVLTPRRAQPVSVRMHVAPVRGGLGWVLRDDVEPLVSGDGTSLERFWLGRVLEAVRDGLLVVDRDRCVLYANRAAEAMFLPHALTVGEAVPDPWSLSIRGLVDDLLEQEGHSAEALAEPDGRTSYWVRAYRSGAGDTVVLLISDISAEERREQAEREFIAHAAHELQSPLTGISGAIEVLLAGAHEDPAARMRFLGHIGRENDRLSRLMQSLLVLAQAQATELDVETEPFAIRPLLEQVAAEAPDPARIDVDCPRQLRVDAHRPLVEHALSNLVANASHHGAPGRVGVRARRVRGGMVEVDVADSGPGIPPQDLDRVFDRFYRGGSRTGAGFGLGLSIARQAARAVGGELALRPNPEGGTIAALTLRGAA